MRTGTRGGRFCGRLRWRRPVRWRHIHGRKNIYDALVTVGIVDGAWKIIGLELLEEKRTDPYAQTTPPDKEAS
jgi:hypothetical protein